MPSTIYAYAFLKAAYGTSVSNPLDAIIPLVKRCLKTDKNKFIDQALVQDQIVNLFGITIPLTVIRYTFPKLATQKFLYLDRDTHRYAVSSNESEDAEITALEQKARAQYQRVLGSVDI